MKFQQIWSKIHRRQNDKNNKFRRKIINNFVVKKNFRLRRAPSSGISLSGGQSPTPAVWRLIRDIGIDPRDLTIGVGGNVILEYKQIVEFGSYLFSNFHL